LMALAQSGTNLTAAIQQAAGALRANLEGARAAANVQGLGDIFGSVSEAAKRSREAGDRRRADINYASGLRSSIFGQPIGGGRLFGRGGESWVLRHGYHWLLAPSVLALRRTTPIELAKTKIVSLHLASSSSGPASAKPMRWFVRSLKKLGSQTLTLNVLLRCRTTWRRFAALRVRRKAALALWAISLADMAKMRLRPAKPSRTTPREPQTFSPESTRRSGRESAKDWNSADLVLTSALSACCRIPTAT